MAHARKWQCSHNNAGARMPCVRTHTPRRLTNNYNFGYPCVGSPANPLAAAGIIMIKVVASRGAAEKEGEGMGGGGGGNGRTMSGLSAVAPPATTAYIA